MIRIVVFDWNGTLTRDRFEIGFFSGLLGALLRDNPLDWSLWSRTIAINRKVRDVFKNHRAESLQDEIVGIVPRINDILESHLTETTLEKYMARSRRARRRQLDMVMLASFKSLREELGVKMGIISSGCRLNIERSLSDCGVHLDFIEANELQRQKGQRGYRYNLVVLGNKGDVLKRSVESIGEDLSNVAYVGDDIQDIPCFQIAGYPILSPWASRDARSTIAAGVNVHAPSTSLELVHTIKQGCRI